MRARRASPGNRPLLDSQLMDDQLVDYLSLDDQLMDDQRVDRLPGNYRKLGISSEILDFVILHKNRGEILA